MSELPTSAPIQRVLVATNRSDTANRAVDWAAGLAAGSGAELVLLQVLAEHKDDNPDQSERDRTRAEHDLSRLARTIAGERGRARVMVDDDPARAILVAIEEERADTVVVGNVGMAGRREFLLGNIPNRVSHNARCNVIIVNTGEAGPQIPYWQRGDTDGALPEGQLLGRAMRIGRVMVKGGVRELLQRRAGGADADSERANRLRDALDELGPTFAKLGQILSTRRDLLPAPYADALETLQDRVTPLTEQEVVAVLEQQLGVPWEDVFASIDPAPLAAGTIAQVHKATLEDGQRVVVKVQRPRAEESILQDLGLLEMFAKRTASRPAFRKVFDLPVMIEYLSQSLRRELDFRQEAANLLRMAEVLEPFPRLAVPRVFESISTSRVLVMEEVQGIPVLQAPPGEARSEAARQLLESYYAQVLTEGFFHADPHPGNLRWWDDRLFFLDLGMVGEVSPEVRELLLMLLLAFAQEDASLLSDVILMLANQEKVSRDFDLAGFRADLDALIQRYRDVSLKEIQLGPILQEVTEISVRHNVRLPASIALTGKAFAQMQLAAAELDPTLDPFNVASSYILRGTLREAVDFLKPQSLFYEARKMRLRVTRAIEALEGITGARPGLPLQVNFGGTERLEETVARTGRRLSLALVVTGTFVGAGLSLNAKRTERWLPMVMGGLGSVLTVPLVSDLLLRRR